MKFSWKIFLSTLLLFCLTFSFGGFLMISSSWSSSLEKEINLAREENKLLRFSIENIGGSGISAGGTLPKNLIRSLAQSIEENTGGRSKIRISDQDRRPLYTSAGLSAGLTLPEGLQDQTRSYFVTESDGQQLIHMSSRITVASNPVYLESFRDISGLFRDREAQYWTFVRLMLALVLLGGIVTFGLSLWLTRPIYDLGRTARSISSGRFDERAQVRSGDEIGQLAVDFNTMADHLQAQMQELTETLKRQEDFIASFAHEIKTPLTSIIGYADMLRLKKLPGEEQFLAADYIFSEGKRLESLAFKLLDLIVLKQKTLTLEPVEAEQVFSDLRRYMIPLTDGGRIQFEAECEPSVLLAEPDLLKTLLFNLADNARKAIDGEGTVTLTGRRYKSGYEITVRDNGKGIPPGDLPRLTEAFYMVDKSRARTQGGAGLGLAICAEIVQLHQGELSFDSEPGRGTTVTLRLKEVSE